MKCVDSTCILRGPKWKCSLVGEHSLRTAPEDDNLLCMHNRNGGGGLEGVGVAIQVVHSHGGFHPVLTQPEPK